MRILHVIDVLTLGGGQGLALRVLDGLQRRDTENALCVLLTARRTHRLWQLPVTPTYLEFHGNYRRLLSWNRCVGQLTRVIREYHPDVVHSVNWLADVTAARACRATKVPHVAYLVDRRGWLTSPTWKPRLRRYVTRRAFTRGNTRCMAVSQAVADFVATHLPLAPERIEVVRNSIDVRSFALSDSARDARSQNSSVTIGMLSTLEEEKGHALCLEAVEELLRRKVPLRMLIAGNGPLRQELEHRVTAPVFEGRVQVIGEIDDARPFYGQCDIFVVPSIRSEGLPTTILEAMASSCAVVATDIGGACEAIESGRSGIIVPPFDPIALADALQQVIQDEAFRKQIQQNAAEHVLKEFDKEKMIDRICEILSNAIAVNAHSVSTIRNFQSRQ